MWDLLVAGFEGQYRATIVLGELQGWLKTWTAELDDAVVVYRTTDGALRVDQCLEPIRKRCGTMEWLLGGLLPALIAAPCAMVGRVDGMPLWAPRCVLPETFTQQLVRIVRPGASAIVASVKAADPLVLADRLRRYGASVLRAALTPERAPTGP